eukprot:2310715-Pyramimonas_sp.AAC.1
MGVELLHVAARRRCSMAPKRKHADVQVDSREGQCHEQSEVQLGKDLRGELGRRYANDLGASDWLQGLD